MTVARCYPFAAVVGQDALKRALLLCAIDPAIGGVLVRGPRGMAKTTLARALGQLVPGPFVELPLGASEERITGTLDLQAALREQRVEFAPGLLARAHQGVLYVDEVNLLADALVDLLLDAAASGENVIERDGVSHAHPARFVLIGTMNPEEGELRPQLLDRFGLCVDAQHEIPPNERVEIVRRRLAFDRDASAFLERFADEQRILGERCQRARERVAAIALDGPQLELVSERCYAAGVEGVRADLALLRGARAHAAWHERDVVTAEDIDAVAELALAHRRKDPSGPPSGGTPRRGPAAGGGTPGARGATARPQNTGSAADGVETASDPGCAGAGSTNSPPSEVGGQETASPAGSANGEDRWGALAPRPVPATAAPALPSWLHAQRGPRPSAQRRGAALTVAALGTRAHARSRARSGPVDWFATLLRAPRPVPAQLIHRARRAPVRQLWLLVLDCSASMLRADALATAKGLAHALEARAARAGAHVAVISFRGAAAHTEVSSRAGRRVVTHGIAALGGGGGTPLREALLEAQRLYGSPAWRSRAIPKRLVLLTDGRTREAVADLAPQRAELELTVIDCERSRVRLGRAAHLAAALGGECHHVDALG